MTRKKKRALQDAKSKLEKSRGVDPSSYKIESSSGIKTFQSDESTPRKIALSQKVLGNKDRSSFSQEFKSKVKQTNLDTGQIDTITTSESSSPRKNPLAQKILGNKDIFLEHADTIDADGNLIVESDRQIKNFGLRRNKEKVKYHDKKTKLDNKAMETLFKTNPELFNYQQK
mgnify:FL=1